MKTHALIAASWLLAGTTVLATEDTYIRTWWVDGLPLKLSEVRSIEAAIDTESSQIDLAEAFRDLGVLVPEGAFIVYDTQSGMLVRRLAHEQHDIVEGLIEHLYRKERLEAQCRAYLSILKPLSPPERVQAVLRIGFVPDQLVASFIQQIRSLTAPPEEDPFIQPPPKPKALTAEQKAKVAELEGQLARILPIAIKRLEEQVAALDATLPNKSE